MTTNEESTTSTSYTDLGTVGTITYTTSIVTQNVLLIYGCDMQNSTSGFTCFATPTISGGTTLAASDTNAASMRAAAAGNPYITVSKSMLVTMNAGVNVIKLQFRVEGNTGTFRYRWIVMIPIGA